MSFLRGLWKSSSKHKKLCEEWALANSRECVEGGGGSTSTTHGEESEDTSAEARFTLKYLGSTLVETPSSEEATAEAIKTVITMAKASGKKLQRVSLAVSLRGIRMTDLATEEDQLQVSIYRISYCSADATHDHVFAFIATNLNETMECHAFLCPKRKMAHTVTLTVAQAFNTAYQAWQLSQSDPRIHHAQEKSPFATSDEIDNNEKKSINETKSTTGKINEQNKQNGQQRRNESQKNLLIDLSNEPKPAGNAWVSDKTLNFSLTSRRHRCRSAKLYCNPTAAFDPFPIYYISSIGTPHCVPMYIFVIDLRLVPEERLEEGKYVK